MINKSCAVPSSIFQISLKNSFYTCLTVGRPDNNIGISLGKHDVHLN